MRLIISHHSDRSRLSSWSLSGRTVIDVKPQSSFSGFCDLQTKRIVASLKLAVPGN